MKQILNEWRKFLNEVSDPEEGVILDSPDSGDPWKFKKEDDKWWAQKNGQGEWHNISSVRYEKTLEKLNAAYPTLSVDISDIEQPVQASMTSQTGTSGTSVTSVTAGSIVHEWNVGDEPTLVYVYPGVGYGTQGYVNTALSGITRTDNTIVLIAKTNRTSWNSFKGDGQAALNGKTPSSVRIVGWSGGSIGLADALSSDSFDKVIYADPSPDPRLVSANHQNAVMYYNPHNWRGDIAYLGPRQEELASKSGLTAIKIVPPLPKPNEPESRNNRRPSNHNELLVRSLTEIVE
jgi:hypothetical protein